VGRHPVHRRRDRRNGSRDRLDLPPLPSLIAGRHPGGREPRGGRRDRMEPWCRHRVSALVPHAHGRADHNHVFPADPPIVSVWLLLAVVLAIMLHKAPIGRKFYATGANPVAAELALIRTRRVWMVIVGLSGRWPGKDPCQPWRFGKQDARVQRVHSASTRSRTSANRAPRPYIPHCGSLQGFRARMRASVNVRETRTLPW
jgi:hypothetical protein